MKQSAGQVDVVSQPGQGTVVRVALSLAGQGRSPARAILANVSAKGQETVLLVEPNEIDRKLALSTLLRHRYQVLEQARPLKRCCSRSSMPEQSMWPSAISLCRRLVGVTQPDGC